jgi:hypothetical protein
LKSDNSGRRSKLIFDEALKLSDSGVDLHVFNSVSEKFVDDPFILRFAEFHNSDVARFSFRNEGAFELHSKLFFRRQNAWGSLNRQFNGRFCAAEIACRDAAVVSSVIVVDALD